MMRHTLGLVIPLLQNGFCTLPTSGILDAVPDLLLDCVLLALLTCNLGDRFQSLEFGEPEFYIREGDNREI